jgi:trehalose/maltose hydrolase-like predicted phosphorylase
MKILEVSMTVIKAHGFNFDNIESLNNKFLLSNGLLGVSGIMDELKVDEGAHVKVNGLFKAINDKLYYQSVFNPLYVNVSVGELKLHPKHIIPKFHEQSLNLDNGIFSRTTRYDVDGVVVLITSERFLDQKNLGFIYSKYTISASKAIDIELTHGIDMSLSPFFEDDFTDIEINNKEGIFLTAKRKADNSHISILYDFDRDFRHLNRLEDCLNQESYSFRLEAKREYQILRYIGISTRVHKAYEHLVDDMAKVKKSGYSKLINVNNHNWEKLWHDKQMEIFNNDLVNRYVKFNQYQMICNRPASDSNEISRYGLSNTPVSFSFANDLYLFKYYLLTDYRSARRMLANRIKHLSYAQKQAEKLGKPGAFYGGTEDNLYINALIVLNLYEYIERTMDLAILDFKALNMVLEIAKFYLNLVQINHKKTNYQTHDVQTLDQSFKNVDNEALLNYLIRDCLGKTANLVALAKTKARKEVEKHLSDNNYDKMISKLREVKNKMYLQMPNVNNLIQLYDKYFKEERKLNNPDLLNLFFLFPEEFKEMVKQSNFDYYAPLSKPDSLGKFILSYVAATQGLERQANKYFKDYLGLNLYDDANKFNDSQAFLDIGLSAAIYLYMVYGLSGVKHDKYMIMADAFTPADIRRIEFKIRSAGNVASVKIKRNSATVEWNE